MVARTPGVRRSVLAWDTRLTSSATSASISRGLNGAERIAYLTSSGLEKPALRSCWRALGGPDEPRTSMTLERARHSRQQTARPTGEPGYWRHWVPCVGGRCLAYDGSEKFCGPDRRLAYLIGHFLRPGALAPESGERWFDEFTFDHVLNGMIVGRRRDTREMFALHVRDNELSREVLVEGDPDSWNYPPLAYEDAIDRDKEWRLSRKRKKGLRVLKEG